MSFTKNPFSKIEKEIARERISFRLLLVQVSKQGLSFKTLSVGQVSWDLYFMVLSTIC
jgi:hypothetical protein